MFSNFPNDGEIRFTIHLDKIKKVFILEDDEKRKEYFKEVFKDKELVMTDNVEYALRVVGARKFDLILLDHDLDGKVFVDSTVERTGCEVAMELKNTMNIETFCIIHSMNPTGAANMVKAHPFNTCYIPFFMLKEAFKTKEAT